MAPGALLVLPRVQVALALSDRLGLPADVGLAAPDGRFALDAPPGL
ncbi:MAG TPA: hypothetical protein VLU43_00605 [Anaeromyxobacteraceae bacterium]|nr:hypothetical protein [Anaeromyxobacteraceae bacterium]